MNRNVFLDAELLSINIFNASPAPEIEINVHGASSQTFNFIAIHESICFALAFYIWKLGYLN